MAEPMGFYTDTTVCIGCKACEVACKEWNLVPEDGPLRLTGDSYDNTGALGANTWRHVAFIELDWTPTKHEQCEGRLHRIGQTEVCHLWNLVAEGTREGEVYRRLLEKLEEARSKRNSGNGNENPYCRFVIGRQDDRCYQNRQCDGCC